MKNIILDTNFLMIPWQFKVDIFSEFERICNFNYRLCIYEQSFSELKNIIQNQSGKDKKAAQFALKLIKLKNIKILKSEKKDVDSLILENFDENSIVATQDFILKRKLLEKGASIAILRQKKYLQLLERKIYK